jgi:hypothetical protein
MSYRIAQIASVELPVQAGEDRDRVSEIPETSAIESSPICKTEAEHWSRPATLSRAIIKLIFIALFFLLSLAETASFFVEYRNCFKAKPPDS